MITLTAICCFVLGRIKAMKYKDRVDIIRDSIMLIEFIKEEVTVTASEIDAIINAASKRRGMGDFLIVKLLCEADIAASGAASAFDHAAGSLKIGEQERGVLISFGASIGKSDRDSQRELCTSTVCRLEKILDQAEDESNRMVRMWTSLGAIVGAFSVIAFI